METTGNSSINTTEVPALTTAEPTPAPSAAEPKPKRELIKVLRSGKRIFESTGYSHIKVTVDGESRVLTLPIRSRGISEIMDRLNESAPKPPFTRQLVHKDSPEGRDLIAQGLKIHWQGTPARQWVEMADLGDKDYIRALEEHQTRMVMETINQGLDVEFQDEEGNPITDPERKLNELRQLGLTPNQFTTIVNDITELTTMTDLDRDTFFGKNSGADPARKTG